MHKSTKDRLVQLSAKLEKKVTEFARNPQDEDPSLAKKAAVGAGVLGAGYAGASLLRGRQWQKKVLGATDNSVSGMLGALRTGNAMNVAGAKGAYRGSSAATSAFVAGSKEKLAQASSTVAPSIAKARQAVATGAAATKKLVLRK